ncbi:MAG: lactate utilization protein [Proteobacteria bacterium]|nr:lactate utilization protein [Pseudomonadota bacterium]MBU1418220.1 lactate utilization protein [Pseudomonadota bacterium]
MQTNQEMLGTFIDKAGLVSAKVSRVKTLEEAFVYTAALCDTKEMCPLLVSGCELNLSEPSMQLCREKTGKIIAAPGLDKEQFASLRALCEDKGMELIEDGLRRHLGGLDIGFTVCDLGIAETGTLVLNSSSEEVRLATMVCETHVAVLPESKLRATSYDAEPEILEFMSSIPNYLSFITGASRTADIERVLALGVHGPLELHILLWEDK